MKNKLLLFFTIAILFFIIPKAAKAATLYLSPSSGTYTVYDNFNVTVYVSSADQAMNAAEAIIAFPASKLSINSISTSGTIIDFWAKSPTYSNTAGTSTFAGIVFTPGYTGSAGKLVTISFSALEAGTANVTFNYGSVLANDGQGTEILTGTTGATFTINAYPPPAAPTVTSPTHPVSDTWYESNDPVFNWTNPAGITAVHASIDQIADTTPVTSIGVVQTRSYTDVANGEWYFHIRLQNIGGWSGTTHYKIRIATPDPPSAPTITSPTHPVSAVCYESNDPVFNWTNPSNITGVRALINQTSDTIPTTSIGVVQTYTTTDIANGKWYFHVRLQNAGGWGGTAHYEINICTPDPPAAPTVTSTTHPDSNVWYVNNDPVFNWTNPSGITGVRVLIDGISNSTPTTSAGTVETYSATDIAVGEWYFHVRLQNIGGWGGIAHYKFRVNAESTCEECAECPSCPTSSTCSTCPACSVACPGTICPVCTSKEKECPICEISICPVCKQTEIECPIYNYKPPRCPVCKSTETECAGAQECGECPICEVVKGETKYKKIIKEKVKFIFVSEDENFDSAIDHYEIQIEGFPSLTLNVKEIQIYEPPLLGPGIYKTLIKAMDKDGNIISERTAKFFIGEGDEEVVKKKPVKQIFFKSVLDVFFGFIYQLKKLINFLLIFLGI